MSRFIQLYQTTVGKKFIAAVTGIVLFGFVVLHMVGNLKAFLGPNAAGVPDIDVYAKFLRTMGEPLLPYSVALWTVRIILIIALILHLTTVISLATRNTTTRSKAYHQHNYDHATWPARLMLVSGFFLLLFIIFHLLQFTTGTVDVTPIVDGEVYANLYYAFQKWYFALIYLSAMTMLGLHLYHGAWSLFQTLGFDNPDRNRALRMFACVAALIVFLGFSSIPVMFFSGAMSDPPQLKPATEAAMNGGS